MESWQLSLSLSLNDLGHHNLYLTPAPAQQSTDKCFPFALTLICPLCLSDANKSTYITKALVKCDDQVKRNANNTGVKFNWRNLYWRLIYFATNLGGDY
jgi:hypothetical protein